MSDLIDRDLLIKSIDYICTPGGIWAKPFAAYKEAFKEFVKGMPSAIVMKEDDLLELEHRYGKEVRATVEDMLSGEGKRWRNEYFNQEGEDAGELPRVRCDRNF